MHPALHKVLELRMKWLKVAYGCWTPKAMSPQGQLGMKGLRPPAGPPAIGKALWVWQEASLEVGSVEW